jgi:RNA-directed DNA polymerase
MPGAALVNTGDPELEYAFYQAERRVLEIQAKLHRWARDDSHRRFDDLFNLVCDPAFLLVAWARVRSNKGARSAGVDGQSAYAIQARGVEVFLDRLRTSLKDRSFRPLPVRERMIPKAGGKKRRLGIATITDRVVQASLKLVLEPVFEADFLPCSYGFRPNRRAHDAVAEVRYLASRPRDYEWIVEGDIKACLDAWSHCSFADCHDQNSWSWGLGSSIRRPFMRPVRVRTARSSPRFTRCNMVWRETPRARVA